ncbi:MAG: mechanosensitive ion channel family protein [Candidatus Methylomirabilales bacterium]
MTGISMENLGPVLFRAAAPVIQAVLRIGLVVVAGYVGARFLRVALGRLESLLIKAGERTEMVPGATQQRVATLIGLLRTIALVVLWAVVVIVSLDQIGLNVTPILAGAGIVGLAVGFGAQNLVRDVISGFFMVLENQVRVGDVAIVNGTGGLVEAITFRTIRLRDLSGVVHVFPNGTVSTLANMTMEWSAYLMDIGAAYMEDTDRIVAVMRRVAEELRQDPVLGPMILEPIEVFGVDNFADSAVIIKARLKTRPIQQWAVGREYRRRLKKAFDAEGIGFPSPQHSIRVGEASKPLPVLLTQGSGSGPSE